MIHETKFMSQFVLQFMSQSVSHVAMSHVTISHVAIIFYCILHVAIYVATFVHIATWECQCSSHNSSFSLLKFTSESVLSYVNLFPLVEKKRIQRMKRAGKDKPTMETYESLVSYDAFF